MREFTIDEEYLTDVTVRQEKRREVNNKHDLINAIKNPVVWHSVSNKDHDEFTKLREYLEENGYIRIERSWWNGDRVLKSFKLNGHTFKKGAQFPCASAMSVKIKVAKKYGWKTLL